MSLLTAKDFPRWTRQRLGLPLTANLSEEIDRAIIRAEDHVRSIIGDDAFEGLVADGTDNADRRRRFASALHALVESELHHMHAESLGTQVGSSTQGKRSRTVAQQSSRNAASNAERSRRQYAEAMFALGYTVRPEAIGFYYTTVTR